VWDKEIFTLKQTLRGHTGSVLALENAEDKQWLFSSSGKDCRQFILFVTHLSLGDSTVRVRLVYVLSCSFVLTISKIWSTQTLSPLYVLHPYLETAAGDLFSLVWSSALQTIYIGCQNTSLQWYDLRRPPVDSESCSGTSTPGGTSRRPHRFFDSYPQYEHRPADARANNGLVIFPPNQDDAFYRHSVLIPTPKAALQIPATNVVDSAHYGYVYCLALLPSTRDGSDDQPAQPYETRQLVTGSGDETVKVFCRLNVLPYVLPYVKSYGTVHSMGLICCILSNVIKELCCLWLYTEKQSTLVVKMATSRFGILRRRHL
jgi:di- and tripeptidase